MVKKYTYNWMKNNPDRVKEIQRKANKKYYDKNYKIT